tara:strand:- start:3040 stop:4992 length:1953 start_codon:yes stop_codon:yes gene_type:complete
MANGPMGGFMPTPAAPAQPPSVKLDTTAASRGTFNEFLRNMNGAMNPPLAPMVGANPMMAPAANIDIFNQPVQNFQFGGFADDTVGDTSGSFSVDDQGNVSDDFSIGGGGFGGTGGDEQSFVDALTDPASTNFDAPATDIFADDAQASVGTNVGLEKAGGFTAGVQKDVPGRFTAFRSPSFAMRGIARDFRSKINDAGDDGLTVSNYFNTFNPSDDNAERLKEFEELTGKKAGDKLNIGDMQNIMNIQAKYEAGIRDVPGSVQNAILSTVNIDDDRKVEDILGNLDLGRLDTKNTINPFEVNTNQVFSPAMAGLPTVTSRFNQTKPKSDLEQLRDAVALTIQQTTRPQSDAERGLQQNQAIQQGFNLGPTTFDDDLANFRANERDTSQRIGPPQMPDTVFDIDTRPRGPVDTVFDIDTRSRGPVDTVFDIDTTTRRTTTDDTDPREDTLGVLPAQTIADIERLSNVPVGQRKAGPGSDPTFFQGLGLPSFFDGIERFSRDRMAAKLATGKVPEDRIVRNDSGRVVALKDQFGRTVEGVDPNEQIFGSDDNQEPIIRRPIIAPKEEEKKDDDRPPNIIGGTEPIATLPIETPTVIASPFAPATSKIEPVTFDSGQLNRLIELLTGVSAKPVVSAAEGGLIRAVDDFLATGT